MQKIPFMSSRERFMAALFRKPFDVYPAASITSTVNSEAMEKTRCFLPAAHCKAFDMAMLSSFVHDEYGFDSVSPYFSLHIEASLFGCNVSWGDQNSMPRILSSPEPGLEDLAVSDDFFQHGAAKELLSAIRGLAKRYQGKVAIIGKVVGPWTLMYHLYGVENVILDSIISPDRVKAILELLTDEAVRFARLQFSEGADAVVWADHVTEDLVSKGMYERMLLPFHRKAVEMLGPDHPLILHVCGNVESKFPLFRDAGFRAFHADSRNSIASLASEKGGMALAGAVNNPKTLLSLTPGYVKSEVMGNISDGVDIISPECAIPTRVPGRNLTALAEAAHSIRYRG